MEDSPDHPELISVIVPAYNAAETIRHSLESALAQTHRNIEIIVVDDGSTDGTARIVAELAAADGRIQLVRQANEGVAKARNAAIELAKGRFIAPLDADDLWRSDKLELQLAAVRRSNDAHRTVPAGPCPNERGDDDSDQIGAAYCWFATIDDADHVLCWVNRSRAEGDVLGEMSLRNIVGNGSAPLMLRSAVLDAGGYDPGLRAANAEGCEDYKLYFQLAESYRFALVREYLVGYRIRRDSMSRQSSAMARSRQIVTRQIASRRPDLIPTLRRGNIRARRLLVTRHLRDGDIRSAWRLTREMFAGDLRNTIREFSEIGLAFIGNCMRRLRRVRRATELFSTAAGSSINRVAGARK